jgi:hypothetical protein
MIFLTRWCITCAIFLPVVTPVIAQPRIFFSDLESGPKSGGEKNSGAFVTLYGKRFGATRGQSSITVGGGPVAAYPLWTDTKIVLQLGAAAATGDIVVTTLSGRSNTTPFAVRPGQIYFVSTTGNDRDNGSFASPWRTVLKARDTMLPGDITYAMDGVGQVTDDGQSWAAAFTLRPDRCGGESPRALIAYPGATVTIGSLTGPPHAIRGVDPSASGGACSGSWVFAGLILRGQTSINLWGPSKNWRVVGNDMSCPEGDGPTACAATALASDIKFLGNRVHNVGRAGASALYQGVYFGTDSNNVELGWNTISEVRGCRGVQVYSHPLGSVAPDSGRNQFGFSIHDNLIHDTQCDGIVLYTVDPSKGKVEIYNNIIYNAGTGNTPERTGNWSCIMIVGTTNYGDPGGGTVELFNNTVYNCGINPNPPYGRSVTAIGYAGSNPKLYVRLLDNIVYQPPGVPYLTVLGLASGVRGSHNLFFGNGAVPSNSTLTSSLNTDPQFVNLGQYDFHLTVNSPARHFGIETSATADYDGLRRGGDAGFDLGALQFTDRHSENMRPPRGR